VRNEALDMFERRPATSWISNGPDGERGKVDLVVPAKENGPRQRKPAPLKIPPRVSAMLALVCSNRTERRPHK